MGLIIFAKLLFDDIHANIEYFQTITSIAPTKKIHLLNNYARLASL